MSLVFSIGIYYIMIALACWLTDLCLRKWRRTKVIAGRLRACWLVPALLLSALPVAGTLLPDSPAKYAFQAAGNVWLGFFLYYGLFLAMILLLMRVFKVAWSGRLHWHGGALCIALAMSVILFGYGLIHAQHTKVVSYDLALDKPAGEEEQMKLVLIGDLHLGVNSRLSTTKKMVKLINAQQPDVVVVAGDIFTSSYDGLSQPEQYAEALRGIEAKYGVYAVYGNHDVEETLFGGFPISPVSEAFRTEQMERFFDDCGFITLADETVTLGGGVQLAGRIDGEKAGDGTANRLSPRELLKDVDAALPVLVLEHEPIEFEELKLAGADVALCGHTHAGQLFPGSLVVPFFNENVWGYRHIHDLDTFVTAGVGYYGPPMRVGTDSEITVINMTFKGDEER